MSEQSIPNGNFGRPIWAVRTPEQLVDHFLTNEDEIFRSFAKNAQIINGVIVDVATELRSRLSGCAEQDNFIDRRLPLRPNGVSVGKIYKRGMSQAQKDLMEGVYAMLDAEQKSPDLEKDCSGGQVWYSGSFVHEGGFYPINLIEYHGRDRRGGFLKWKIVSDVPDHLVNPPNTSIEAQMTRELQVLLNQVGTVDIDEAAIVADYMRRTSKDH